MTTHTKDSTHSTPDGGAQPDVTDDAELLAMASHEIRTPLNAMLGFARLLERDRIEPLTPRQNRRVHQLIATGEHLLRITNDLLELCGPAHASFSARLGPVRLKDVLDHVCMLLEPAAGAQDVTLGRFDGEAADRDVLVDRLRLEQVLLNLGSNAIKYNHRQGSVVFDVVPRDGSRIRVAVTDTGVGVPIAMQARIFAAFERAGQERGPVEGTGLGLTISKRLIDMMGGAIGFTSDPGIGSTFWIELRLAEHG